jgi:predicted nuclease of predicted toxin-antitoxin system
MNFLIDAQLPRRLARFLTTAQHDAVHTLDLPGGNRTPDAELCEICRRDDRVLVTKDSDFTNSFLLRREPPRLLVVSTGNITNRELETLFRAHLSDLVSAFISSSFVELDRSGLTVRGVAGY